MSLSLKVLWGIFASFSIILGIGTGVIEINFNALAQHYIGFLEIALGVIGSALVKEKATR